MQSIYGITRKKLETYFEEIGDKKLIDIGTYTKKKSQGPRPANASYGSKHSKHKLGFISIPGGGRTLHAYDFSPPDRNFMKFLNNVYKDRELVDYMLTHKLGILEEFDGPSLLGGGIKKQTRATGDHTHWGPDVKARAMTIIRLKQHGYDVPDDVYKAAYTKVYKRNV